MRVRLSHVMTLALSGLLIGCGESTDPTIPPPDANATPGPGASTTDAVPPAGDPGALPEPSAPSSLEPSPTPTTPPSLEAPSTDADAGKAIEPAAPEADKKADTGTPKVIEEPAAPTETPGAIEDAPEKGADEVKKEEPPQ